MASVLVEVGHYSLAQRRLHWWGAGLVFLTFALGWIMVAVPLRELLLKFVLYQTHKTTGLLVLLIVFARVWFRATRGRPVWPPLGLTPLAYLRQRAASAMHATLYCLLFVVPVLGYLSAATAPERIPTLFLLIIPIPHVLAPNPALFAILRAVHRALAITLVGLALGHAAAAIYGEVCGDGTLQRMRRPCRA